jgi:hypothetical protein
MFIKYEKPNKETGAPAVKSAQRTPKEAIALTTVSEGLPFAASRTSIS